MAYEIAPPALLPTAHPYLEHMAKLAPKDCRRFMAKHLNPKYPRHFYRYCHLSPEDASSIARLAQVVLDSVLWLTDGINESAAAMRSLGKDAGVVQRLLMAIGGFQFGALGAGKFDTQKLQEQAFQRLAEVKAQKKPLESKDYLNQFDKQTLADLKREEQAVRDLINELAVRRGKETGFQKPDLAGEYLAQQAKQNERVNGYLGDTSNTPKAAKIAAEIEKENKAFEAAVAGMVETDSRYIAALKAHNERVASIKSKGAEKAKKPEKAEAEIDPLTDAAKLYESTIKALNQAQLKADMSGKTLTATEAELMRVMDNPRFAQMPESWQAVIKAQADYVIQAEQSADSQRRLNDLLAATPTAQLERQRETMLFLTDAFKAGKISAEQFSEAASTALGNIPAQAEPVKDSFIDMTTVANDAARAMADGFTDYLFDPVNNSIKDMLLGFLSQSLQMRSLLAGAVAPSSVGYRASGRSLRRSGHPE